MPEKKRNEVKEFTKEEFDAFMSSPPSTPGARRMIASPRRKGKNPNEIIVEDVSDKKVEAMARGYILGTKAIGRRRDIRAHLEDKITKKIGQKGKYLVDQLFSLIDGVYIVQKTEHIQGMEKVTKFYKQPPSLNAITYALDRVLGKPVQKSIHKEEKRGLILVEHVIKNLATKRDGANTTTNETGEDAGSGE